MNRDDSNTGAEGLQRQLGYWPSLVLVLGNMIGIGVFLTASEVAKASPSIGVYFLLWIFGSVMAAAGAHVFAELGALFPRAGGDYAFLDRAYGRPIARAWGWLSVFGSFPASVAFMAVSAVGTLAATSHGAFLHQVLFTAGPIEVQWSTVAALLLLALTTTINILGLSLTGRVQLLLTLIPLSIFGAFSVWAVASSDPAAILAPTVTRPETSLGGLATASCAVFFTFSGWNVLTYMGGEVRRPGRTIPLVILSAVAITTVVYLILNTAFLAVLSLEPLRGVENAGVAMASQRFGTVGSDVFAILLSMAILAGLNATVMAGSRIAMAMGADGLLWTPVGRVNPRRHTPVIALATQGLVAALLVMTGSFSFLLTATGGMMMFLSCITVSTIFVFRGRRGLKPPYPTAGYPWTAVIFLASGALVMGMGLLANWKWLLAGTVVFLALANSHRLTDRLAAASRDRKDLPQLRA